MKILTKMLAIAAMVVAFTGCTQQIPAGYVGKIVGVSGIQPELHEMGRVTVMGRDRLLLIQKATERKPAKVSVIMNDRYVDDKGVTQERIGLKMDFIVNVRYSIKPDDKTITTVLQDMTLDGVNYISAQQVYNKYGNMAVGQISREVLGKYTPEEILGNLDKINDQLNVTIKSELKNSPLVIAKVALGPITLPSVITDRINKNKEVELSEAEKRADQKIALLNEANLKALATQRKARQRIDAQSLAEQNNIIKKSITPEVLELRRLEVQELSLQVMKEFAKSGNTTSFVLPYEALGNTGAQMKMFETK